MICGRIVDPMGIKPEPAVEVGEGIAFPGGLGSTRSTTFDGESSTTTASWMIAPPISRPYYY